jgi:hypothetical protein
MSDVSRPTSSFPGMADAPWMAVARRLDAFQCDAAFQIAETFYVGAENGFTPREWEEARIPLPPPALPCRIPGLVTTDDLLDREDELIAYYQRLIAVAEAHGKANVLGKPFPYFSVGPRLIGGGEVLAGFLWTDDVPDTRSVLEALAGLEPGATGLVWDDQDQGWRILIAAAGDAAYFVEWNAEGAPPVDGGWVLDAATLARPASEALARLETIHGRLAAALGRDFWIYRRAPPAPPIGRVRRAVARILGIASRARAR